MKAQISATRCGRYAVALGCGLALHVAGHTDTLTGQGSTGGDRDASIAFHDGSGEYRWRQVTGSVAERELGWLTDDLWGGPMRLSWARDEAVYQGFVGQYRCLVMCAWFAQGSINGGKTLRTFRYQLDSWTVQREDWVHWSPVTALVFSGAPRLSLHRLMAYYDGDKGLQATQYAATAGVSAAVSVTFNADWTLALRQRVDGFKYKGLMLRSGARTLDIERRLNPSWSVAFGHQEKSMMMTMSGDNLIKIKDVHASWYMRLNATF